MATGIRRDGNARNNFLYGTQNDDTLDGGAGNDYLRGYAGNDLLLGGQGADRFVFERTFAANGTDTITGFEFGTDILDLSLVGFARGVFNRNLLSDVIRMDYGANGTARLRIDLDGGGDSFQTWAVFTNNAVEGALATFTIGSMVVPPVQVVNYPIEILDFSVLNATQLSVTADDDGTAQLFVQGSGTPGTAIGSAVALIADAPGTLNVAAQDSLTVAELRVSEAGGTPTVASTRVYLGSNSDDLVSASEDADMIFGFDGDDTIMGFAGADTIHGGQGTDTLVITATSASLNAQADAAITSLEVVSAAGAAEGVTIDLHLQSEGFSIVGSGFVDSLVVSAGMDTIDTGAGADTIVFGAQGSLAANIDTVTNYTFQTLDFAGNTVLVGAGGAASAGASVQTTAVGKVTFAGADDTLAEKIAALQADARLDAANSVAVFSDGSDAYVYYAGTAAGNADDQVVRLQGQSILDKIIVDGAGNISLDREPPSGALTTAASLLPTPTSWSAPGASVVPEGFTPGNDGNANPSEGDGFNGNTSNLIRNAAGTFGASLFSESTDDSSAMVAVDTSLWSMGLNMFGTSYTTLYAGSNGYITFGSGFNGFSPEGIAGFTRAPMIAAQYDDLYLGNGSRNVTPGAGTGTSMGSDNLYYYADSTKMVFTWDNVGLFDLSTSSSSGNLGSAFQIILHKPTGDDASATNFGIEIRYEEVTQEYSSATAGWTAGDMLNYGLINDGVVLSTVAEQTSNVGVNGVWAWEVVDGAVSAPYYVPNIGIAAALPVAELTFRNASGITGFTITGDGSGSGFTMGPATQVGANMTARLFTTENPRWNLWKDAYMDGQITLTITPLGSAGAIASTIHVDIIDTGNDPVTRSGAHTGTDVLTVSATSADLNTAANGELSGVDTVTAVAAAAGVNINLSSQTESFILIAGSGHDDTLVGASGADTISAGAGNDVLRYTSGAQLGLDSVDGGDDADTIEITAADTGIADAHFTNVSSVETLRLTGISSAVLGDAAHLAGLSTGSGTLQTGSGATSITANDNRHFTIDTTVLAQNTTLTLADGGTSNFTVTGLVGNLATDALAGTLTVTTADAADDGIAIETSTGATAVNLSAGAATDTVSINAADLANDEALTLNATGAAAAGTVSITGLQGNLVLTNASSGTIGVALADNTADDDIHITAGAASLNVTGVADGDTVYVTALTGGFTGAIAGTTGKFDVTAGTGAQSITTGAGDDTITGGAGADTVYAGAGNDTIHGGVGDMLYGEAGNDRFSFDEGDGVTVASAAGIAGGDGTDEIHAWSGIAFDNIFLGDDAFANASGLEMLTLSADGIGSVTLGANADAAFANGITVSNAISTGRLVVNGAAANVAITANGGDANDTLTGGNGDDTLTGGAGTDDMTGGLGADIFVFAAGDAGAISGTVFDIIRDYTAGAGGDTLDLVGSAAAQADAAGVDVAAAAEGGPFVDITATLAAGVITLAGADVAEIDTLAEWLAVARLMVTDDTKVGAFEFGGDTYVYQENTGGDLLIQLDNVTAITTVGVAAADSTILVG